MDKINSSAEAWKQFLVFSANHFTLNASEKLQVYQKNPHATCLATYNQWLKIGKYVRKGQHGIRVRTKNNSYTTYFDVRQTDSKSIELWKYNEAFNEYYFNMLDNIDSLPSSEERNQFVGKTFHDRLYDITYQSLNDRYSATGLLNRDFCDFVAQSIAYSTMSRLSIEPDTSYDFDAVTRFNNEELSFLIGALSVYTNLYLRCAKQTVKTHSAEAAAALARTQQEKYEQTELQRRKVAEYWHEEMSNEYSVVIENYDDVSYEDHKENVDKLIKDTSEETESIPENDVDTSDFTDNLDYDESTQSSKVIVTVDDREDSVDISDEIKTRILNNIVRTELKGLEKSEIEKKYSEYGMTEYFREFVRLSFGNRNYDYTLPLHIFFLNREDPVSRLAVDGISTSDKGLTVYLSDDNSISYDWVDVSRAISSRIDENDYHFGKEIYKVFTASDEQEIYGYTMFKNYREAVDHANRELDNLSRNTASYLILYTLTDRIVSQHGDFPLEQLSENVRKANNIEIVPPDPVIEPERTESHIITAHDRLMERNYKNLQKLFPQIMSEEYSYMHFESSMYEPLSVEIIGDNLISIMQTYTQNGDLMRDPDIVIDISDNKARSTSFENSGLGIYRIYDEPNYDCDSFLADWLKTISAGNFTLTRAVRMSDDEEITFTETIDVEEKPEKSSEIVDELSSNSEKEEIKKVDSVLDNFMSETDKSENVSDSISEDEQINDSSLGTIASTGYLIPSDLNEKITQITEYLGADKEILLDLLSRNPTEETINELGLFNRLKDSVDLDKATAYYRSLNGDPELPMHKAGVWSHKFLKEFILSNGEIDIPIPTSSNEVVDDIVEGKPYELRKYPDTRFTALSDENRELYRMYQPSDLPEDSIWGEIQTSHYINKGIYEVSTASHGGIIMPVGVARYVLSREARREAQTDHGYVYFEEDCDWSVAFRELLDKGLFENIEEYYKETYAGSKDFNGWLKELDRLTDESLKKWHNDYYVKRSDVIHKAMSPEERDEEMGQIALFGFEPVQEPVISSVPAILPEIQERIDKLERYFGINTEYLTDMLENGYDKENYYKDDRYRNLILSINKEKALVYYLSRNNNNYLDSTLAYIDTRNFLRDFLLSDGSMAIPEPKLIQSFNGYYDTLYQYGDNALSNYDTALERGNEFIKERTGFVSALAELRSDIISSDREVAALAYALADLRAIEDFREASQSVDETAERGTITLHKVGSFYEVYDDDAKRVADILGLHLLKRGERDMVGFPDHALENYRETLKVLGSIIIEENYNEEILNSSEDLRREILSGTGFQNGKQRIHQYYVDNQPTTADFAKYLSHEWGIGGHSGTELIGFVNYDRKGIQIIYENGEKITHTWKSVAKITEELIKSGEYLPEADNEASISNDDVDDEIISENTEINYKGKIYTVDKINKENDTVTLKEQISGWYPVFHDEPLSEVIAEVANGDKERSQQMLELSISAEKGEKKFHITDRELGVGGPKEKYKRNVEAIKTLKLIEVENRAATDEEKITLSQYVGWGGIPDAFNDKSDSWSKEYDELKSLLTEEEYSAALSTVNDAFYTQPIVIEQIYKALERFGFKGGKVLEPACGIGNFIGCCPEELAEKSKFTAIEIDSISGRIAKQLYPRADIQITGYQDARLKDNSFDVAIGNVPFGSTTVIDRKYNKTNAKIHDYFFLKTLEMVRPNGIVAFITSSGTMDKTNSKIREMISEKADLIGAIRLPNNAFKANAGTEVVSDIIFLQKRLNPMTVRDSWIDLDTTMAVNNLGSYVHNEEVKINGYYAENPDMICGRLQIASHRFGYEPTVAPFDDISLEEALSERINKLSDNIVVAPVYTPSFEEEVAEAKENAVETLPLIPGVRDSGIIVSENSIYKREGSVMVRITPKYLNVSEKAYIGYVKLARLMEQTRSVIQAQVTDIEDSQLQPSKDILHEMYLDFVKTVGHFDDPKVKKMIKKLDTDDSTAVLSLEKRNDEPKKENETDYQEYKEADIFKKRTAGFIAEITHADTVVDAYQASFALKGYIDIEHISSLCDKSVEDCISELNGTLMFREPMLYINGTADDDITKGWIPADEYLSGEVVEKYKVVEYQSQFHKELEINRDALKAVQPERIKAVDIEVQLGSPFVSTKHIERFIHEVFDIGFSFEVEHNLKTARWYISNKSSADYNIVCNSEYGTKDRNALFILENCLNLSETKVYYTDIDADGNERRVLDQKKTLECNNKAESIKERFREWVYQDAIRTREIEDKYNEMFNSTRLRTFDGSHLKFNGMNPNISLDPHQYNAVARILYGDNTLLAHVVGAGKTFTMCAGIMEQKRIGTINKALLVVPNHLLAQWGSEFLTLYPNANILLATTEDFKKENRKRFLTKIALNDYDAIIMGHSTFSMIQISPEKREQFYRHEIDECMEIIKSGSKKDLSVKDAQSRMKQLENTLKNLEYVKDRDSVVYFEELGVDALYVDEAHMFKNLHVLTKLSRIAGISTSASKRSEDMLMKIQYITEKNSSHKGVVFATGTPVSNSMTEMYVMQKYLQSDYLARKGLQAFDSWIACYGKIERSAELGPTGQWRMKTRCGKFNNVPELLKDFKRVADVQTRDMLDLPVPKLKGDKPIICISKPSEEQKMFIMDCADRAERVHRKEVPPNVDNMLCITNDGKMCAIDMRLVDPEAEDRPDSKINMAVENILDVYEQTMEDRLAQVVFLDKSPPSKEFNLYDDIKQKLIKGGVPEKEIAFIHDAKTDAQKLAMFDKVNKGDIRVILGSTDKMGAGTNIQQKLVALHHIDVPWRPSDIEQREGRILRQGNKNKEVQIFRYVTEETFDSYSWQTIETKQKYIAQVMTDKPMGRSIDDLDEAALSYAEIKMLATGDTRIKEQLELQNRVAILKSKKAQFDASQISARDNLQFKYPNELKEQSEITKLIKEEVAYTSNYPKPSDEEFKVNIRGTDYTSREEAGKAVRELRKAASMQVGGHDGDISLCDYRGYKISMHWVDGTLGAEGYSCYQMMIKHKTQFTTSFGISNLDVFDKIDKALDVDLLERNKTHTERLTTIENNIAHAKEILEKKFPELDEYNEKSKKLMDLTNELQLNDHSDMDSFIVDDEPLDKTNSNSKGLKP